MQPYTNTFQINTDIILYCLRKGMQHLEIFKRWGMKPNLWLGDDDLSWVITVNRSVEDGLVDDLLKDIKDAALLELR